MSINWRMLTNDRPGSKMEETFFEKSEPIKINRYNLVCMCTVQACCTGAVDVGQQGKGEEGAHPTAGG